MVGRFMNGWIDRWIDGWMDGWMDEWMNGKMDELMDDEGMSGWSITLIFVAFIYPGWSTWCLRHDVNW